MLALLAAIALASAPADDYGWDEDEESYRERRPRLHLTALVGEAFQIGSRDGVSGAAVGGEVAWSFDALDLGVAGYGYRLRTSEREWVPVTLLRLTQRAQGRGGIEALFSFGVGAGKPLRSWDLWFQVGLGVRVPLGPMFLAGELAFEQYDLLRLQGGVGARF